MKKTLNVVIGLATLGLFFSCSAPEMKKNEVSSDEGGLVLITPFIESRVMVYDTTQLDLIKDPEKLKMYRADNKGRFLDEKSLEVLKAQLKITFNDPNALIYLDAGSQTTLPLADRKKMYLICDSIRESNIDKSGKEIISTIFMCDSTSFWDRITTVRYYESWHYNSKTGEIVKKQLGYSMLQWDDAKEAYREPYVYFTSKEAKDIVVKNY